MTYIHSMQRFGANSHSVAVITTDYPVAIATPFKKSRHKKHLVELVFGSCHKKHLVELVFGFSTLKMCC